MVKFRGHKIGDRFKRTDQKEDLSIPPEAPPPRAEARSPGFEEDHHRYDLSYANWVYRSDTAAQQAIKQLQTVVQPESEATKLPRVTSSQAGPQALIIVPQAKPRPWRRTRRTPSPSPGVLRTFVRHVSANQS
ncbi:hypothetical protein JYU34_012307 [Plutella xylostella]|uniref:Uncharacterized protein n=1 Tax=Plutella xylostella TaxID=51655 RepID=A0ABQ7QG32_PLUXY|nr:hypothetical protein JYU34_012307 [Plutella xylostella]